MSTDHEKLITEAAKAISAYEWEQDRLRGDKSQLLYGHRGASVSGHSVTQEGRARAAFAVFEKAHTPTAGSCWDEAPSVPRVGECAPVPVLCELVAGHLGAHRSGATEWMRGREAHTPTDDEREARDTAFEAAKLEARNSMRHDPHVWHEALEDALDKVLPAVWQASAGFRRTVQGEPSVTVATKPAIDAARKAVESLEDWEIQPHAAQEILSALDDIPDCESWTAVPHVEHVQSEPTPRERTAEFEALEMDLYKHRPVISADSGAIVGCECMDRVFYRDSGEDWGTHLAELVEAEIANRAGVVSVQDEPSDEQVLAALNAQWRTEHHQAKYPEREPAPDLSFFGNSMVERMRAALRAAGEVR